MRSVLGVTEHASRATGPEESPRTTRPLGRWRLGRDQAPLPARLIGSGYWQPKDLHTMGSGELVGCDRARADRGLSRPPSTTSRNQGCSTQAGASLTAAWVGNAAASTRAPNDRQPLMSCPGFMPAAIAVGQKPTQPASHSKSQPSWTVTEPKSSSITLRTTTRVAMSTTIRTWIAPDRWVRATKIE